MAEKFDTDQIKRDNPLSEYLPRRGFSLKRDGREWKCLCPFHAETDASFTIFQSREGFQKYQCFPCGAFGNVIDFVQEYDGVTFPEACEILGGTREAPTRERAPRPAVEVSDPYSRFTVLRPPADAPGFEVGKRTVKLRNPKRDCDGRPFTTYIPDGVYPYRDADGALIGYVLRQPIETAKGPDKLTPLLLWCRESNGFEGWTHHPMPEPRPLYGLDRIAASPSKQWLVVEGEKCKDVAADLLPALVAVSWQGGGKAPHKTDWSPARGKSIVVWMDNDDEGERTVLGFWKADDWRPGVVEMLLRAGAKSVKVIGRNHAKPNKWDVADAYLKDGWTPEEILSYAKENARVWTLSNIEGRKASLKNSAPLNTPRGADSPVVESAPATSTAATPRPQMKVVHGGQAVTAQARQPQPERVVVPGEVPQIKRYSTALAIDDTVELDLLQRMEMDDKGNPRKRSVHNFIVTSLYHPQMKGVLAWDEFSRILVLAKRPPWVAGSGDWEPREFTDDDALLASAWFSRKVNLQPNDKECGKAMLTAARQANRVNPLRDYLERLKWDGMPRVQGEANVCAPWLTEYLGVHNSKINGIFGMRWLIAAVARIYSPGCKVDNMLVLEGDQDLGKSSALRELGTLGARDYFTDAVHDFSSDKSVHQMRGKWILEIAELDALYRSETSTVKAFITRQVDNIRIPYATRAEDFPRNCILAGTVNPGATGYLKDPTGARRFWPVCVTKVEIERLREDKAQLWAEAVHLYKSGVQWWLTDEEKPLARAVQEERQEQEPWAEAINAYVRGMPRVTMDGVLTSLAIPRAQWPGKVTTRAAEYLKSIGWTKTRRRDEEGELTYFYYPPEKKKNARSGQTDN